MSRRQLRRMVAWAERQIATGADHVPLERIRAIGRLTEPGYEHLVGVATARLVDEIQAVHASIAAGQAAIADMDTEESYSFRPWGEDDR